MKRNISKRKISTLLLTLALIGGCATTSDPAGTPSQNEAARLNLQLGIGYMQTGRFEVAQDKLRRALQFDNRFAEAENALGVLHEETAEPSLAERHYRRALEIRPNYLLAKMNLGRLLCSAGNTDQGRALFLEAATHPEQATPEVAYTGAGVCSRIAENLPQAEQDLRQALEYNAFASSTLFEMASVSYEVNSYQDAQTYLERYHRRNRFTSDSLQLAIAIEQNLGNLQMQEYYSDLLHSHLSRSARATTINGMP
jgi:type IV pilus assembly protein PilF